MDLVIRTPHLPARGETVLGHEFTTVPGGKGANQAVAAARLGASVSLVGRVGADDFGRALRENMKTAGVDTTYVSTDRQAHTGVAVIEVETLGENHIVVAPGANAHLLPANVHAARRAIMTAQVLVAQLEVPLETVLRALQLARDAGLLTILNPAPAQPLPAQMFELIDILIPNETEASRLSGITVKDSASAQAAARELRRRGAHLVVITRGEQGAFLDADGDAREFPAFRVPVIDTTAAGDAFVGAFAVAQARGLDLERAMHLASAAGALATTKFGAQPSMPTRAELQEFLDQRAP